MCYRRRPSSLRTFSCSSLCVIRYLPLKTSLHRSQSFEQHVQIPQNTTDTTRTFLSPSERSSLHAIRPVPGPIRLLTLPSTILPCLTPGTLPQRTPVPHITRSTTRRGGCCGVVLTQSFGRSLEAVCLVLLEGLLLEDIVELDGFAAWKNGVFGGSEECNGAALCSLI